jgi:hypothetical protein
MSDEPPFHHSPLPPQSGEAHINARIACSFLTCTGEVTFPPLSCIMDTRVLFPGGVREAFM